MGLVEKIVVLSARTGRPIRMQHGLERDDEVKGQYLPVSNGVPVSSKDIL